VTDRYRPDVLAALLTHGIRPRPHTPPRLVAEYLNDLYRFELRRLRSTLVAGKLEKRLYAGAVAAVKARYPLLALPTRFWLL
jgi:hypothetical protein